MPRVLVVDDDRGIRELLRIALEYEGYAVTTLGDGRAVVERLAELTEPCVVLMDLSMPHMTGWEVCAALEANPAALASHQIVILTAERLPDGACPTPARTLVTKPFDLDTICRLVASLFAQPGMAPVASLHAGCATPSVTSSVR
ncbi:MAG: response regulator [Ktedonobacterales bacterium]|nr:response regulator [Ktedonobacterales bacterium]